MTKRDTTLTLGTLYNGVPMLNKLVKAHMPASKAFKINEIINIIQPQIEAFETTRTTLIEKYSEKDENNKPVVGEERGTVKLSDPESFYKELQELVDTEVTITIPKLPVTSLDTDVMLDGEVWRPNINDIASISFMLVDK